MIRLRCDGAWLIFLAISTGCGSVKSMQDMPPDATSVDTSMFDAAASTVRYDIGYIDELTFGVNAASLSSLLLVVNEGTDPLKISTASVVTFDVVEGGVEWTFTKVADATSTLAPGHATGNLSPAARMQLVTGAIVTEPIDEQTLDFAMSFPHPPPVDTTFHARAVIRIDGVDLTLPFTIHTTGDIGIVDFNSTTRLHAGAK